MEDAAFGLAELYGSDITLLEGWAILDYLNQTETRSGTLIFVPTDTVEFENLCEEACEALKDQYYLQELFERYPKAKDAYGDWLKAVA